VNKRGDKGLTVCGRPARRAMSLNEILWDESDRANGECVTSTESLVDDEEKEDGRTRWTRGTGGIVI
jgi:hypothetical protein